MIIESRFKPAWWMTNRHLQTGWQKIHRRKLICPTIQQRLELADGDFIDIHWSEKPKKHYSSPLVIVLHGLEGSVRSTYARGMMNAVRQQGWIGVLMHFRSCGGIANRLARAYHSGDTEDLNFLITYLRQKYPNAPCYAVGFSLGANVLVKFNGEQAKDNPLSASVAICPPLDLAASCLHIQRGFAKVYQKYLLDMMLDNLARKMQSVDLSLYLGKKPEKFNKIRTIWQFDQTITAPLHGYRSAQDYYQKCSGRQFLKQVQKPLLVIHAADDPFLSPDSVPQAHELSSHVTFELSQKGGHVGFISGPSPRQVEYWLETRTLEYFRQILAANKPLTD
ncbi:hydrolase [Gayadomonas joobiniege]|uniref:hydrolase n=1 Tax=Gayadomonas joobiniege TaxID=1234606 RepID=UPI00036536C3|nr:hydrolase [Gayadomonas joobiniege]